MGAACGLPHRTLVAFACVLLLRSVDARNESWPPFLPSRAAVPNADDVRAAWANPTFERQLEAPPVRIAQDIYVALIDAPDVLTSAANHLGLTEEKAEALSDGSFKLTSPDGSFAVYRVLSSAPGGRVIFSKGERVFLGMGVRAAVLGELSLSDSEDGLKQDLKVYVRVENRFLSWMTRALRLLLPSFADDELLRGFRLAREVAGWVADDRPGFCRWLSARPPTARTRTAELAVGC